MSFQTQDPAPGWALRPKDPAAGWALKPKTHMTRARVECSSTGPVPVTVPVPVPLPAYRLVIHSVNIVDLGALFLYS